MRVLMLFLAILLLSVSSFAQLTEQDREWNTPVEPFKIVAMFTTSGRRIRIVLITSPKGHILIDSGFAETVPLIKANVEKLGSS